MWHDEYENAKDAKKDAESIEDGLVWSRKEVQPVEFALQCAKTTLEALQERFKPEVMQIYLTGPGNFRDSLAVTKPYKGNRLEAKPRYYNEVANYLVEQWGAGFVRGLEADDAIGISLSRPRTIAVTIDKDLDQVPGWHYNWVDSKLYQVSRKDGDFALYTQILAGDSTDNVPGLEGIGPAKARNILDGSKSSAELAARTWAAYQDAGKSREYLEEQANLVYIWRKWDDKWNLDQALKLE